MSSGWEATWWAYNTSGEQLTENSVHVNGVSAIDIPAEAAFVVVSADTELYGVWIANEDGITSIPLTQDSSTSQA